MKINRKIVAGIVIIAFALITLTATGAFALTKKLVPNHFPLKVGNWWKYKNMKRGFEFTIKVVGKEKVNGVECYKVETIAGNNKPMIYQWYSNKGGKIQVLKSKFMMNNKVKNYDPPKLILHNPLKTGDSWKWEGKGMMGVDIKEKKKVGKTEKVKVPAGTFSATAVQSNTIQGGQESKITRWYADHVGMVKAHTKTKTVDSSIVLVDYKVK